MTFEWVSPVCLRGHHDRCGAVEKCDCDCHDPDSPEPEAVPAEGLEEEIRPDGRRRPTPPAIEVVFGELPPVRKPSSSIAGRLADAVAELRARPGEWAKVAEYGSRAGSGAQGARTAMTKAYPDIEWTCRTLEPRGSALWGRARPR